MLQLKVKLSYPRLLKLQLLYRFMNEIDATLVLAHTPFLGAASIKKAVDFLGSASAVLHAIKNQIVLPFTLRQESLDYLLNCENKTNWQEDKLLVEKEMVTIIPYTSCKFPEMLKQISDAPPLIYVKGTLPEKKTPWVAIVGTRAASFQAMEDAQRFATILAQKGVVVISGLARGIDTAAHKGSLVYSPTCGATIAVIGSGLCDIYPTENIQLANQIAASSSSAVISEFPMNLAPSRYTFPKRNRIISALSDAILLCEAPRKSGGMITMELGAKHKKKLFALPGRAGGENSCGNNWLIKSGLAQLVDHPEEILAALGFTSDFTHLKSQISEKCTFSESQFTKDEQKIVGLLMRSQLSLDELVGINSMPISTLQAILIKLILKKIVLELPGKRYKLNRN